LVPDLRLTLITVPLVRPTLASNAVSSLNSSTTSAGGEFAIPTPRSALLDCVFGMPSMVKSVVPIGAPLMFTIVLVALRFVGSWAVIPPG
jgi:hypothetical protein